MADVPAPTTTADAGLVRALTAVEPAPVCAHFQSAKNLKSHRQAHSPHRRRLGPSRAASPSTELSDLTPLDVCVFALCAQAQPAVDAGPVSVAAPDDGEPSLFCHRPDEKCSSRTVSCGTGLV